MPLTLQQAMHKEQLNNPIYQPPALREALMEAIRYADLMMQGYKEMGGTFVTDQVEREFTWALTVKQHLGIVARRYVAAMGPNGKTVNRCIGDWEFDLDKALGLEWALDAEGLDTKKSDNYKLVFLNGATVSLYAANSTWTYHQEMLGVLQNVLLRLHAVRDDLDDLYLKCLPPPSWAPEDDEATEVAKQQRQLRWALYQAGSM